VPLDADPALITAVAALHARILAATEHERTAAIIAVSAALESPLMQRAARALECRREVPVMHRLADGTIARGIADLVFREPSGWMIVDFKTDAELSEGGPYAEQVLLYMEAVHAATGEPVSGALLSV
jgi:ATP-dependent helicase/nuclease subunit A